MNGFRATAARFNTATTFTKPSGGFRTKLASFCFGATIFGAIGYLRLHSDIHAASEDVKNQINATQVEVNKLISRIEYLEKAEAERQNQNQISSTQQ